LALHEDFHPNGAQVVASLLKMTRLLNSYNKSKKEKTMSVNDKVTIISGASGGLGQTVSRIFHQNGAQLVLVGSRQERLQPLLDALGSERVLPVAANLTNPDGAEQVVEAALKRIGRVDILLNLAGGFAGGTPVHQSDADLLGKMLALNLHTTYNLSRAAAGPMIEQQWGRIVNTASRDALQGRANYSAYAISKAAVLRLTEAMAAELKPFNISVNAVLPGTIDTTANRQAMPKADPARWVKPATIAETMLFLAAENSAINGAGIPLFEQV
jgi:NAD(P)-dependent dehydrogenase (short-subunit alcohol dehydrogenase family)